MMLGRIDDVDGDFVATEFLVCAIPTASVYVADPGARTTRSGDGRVRILTDWRSVVLGYIRFWLPLIAVGCPSYQAVTSHVLPMTWLASGVGIVVAVASLGAGRLGEAEKARLRVLGTVSGLRLDPSRLREATRMVKRDLLGQLMTRAGIPTTPEGILEVLDEIPVPAMPLVFGYACYSGDSREWRECAELVYARYEVAEK
jgi:hypothetical protein